VITFRIRHSRYEMCIGHMRVCVCLSVPHHIPTLLYGPGCNLGGNGRGCHLVVHYLADLQLVHGFHRFDNIHVCKLIALYTVSAYSAECEMSASACTGCIAGLVW